MRTIVTYIKDFIKEDYKSTTYLLFFIFLAIAIFINYYFDFNHRVLYQSRLTPKVYLLYFLFFSFSYFSIAFVKFALEKKLSHFNKSEFIIKSLVFISLISVASGFYHYRPFIPEEVNRNEFIFTAKVLISSKRLFLYTFPLLIVLLIYDRKEKFGLYGFNFRKFNVWPYFFLLLIITPLIVWASFQPDFLQTYPTFKPINSYGVYGMNISQTYLIYEFFYGMDFLFVELIFRGALVIGMIKVLGKDAILPMVATYTFLHFGKPCAETISSVFGGYVLGIIAYRTKSIWGGCIIHIGVALLMEITALYQYYLNGAFD